MDPFIAGTLYDLLTEMQTTHPLIIAHRGACGLFPEHTLGAFQRALADGADALETDVVLTRDAQLICRHDCELSLTTDVANHPEFAERHTRKMIDGEFVAGWFVEEFTLAEIQTLRARQRFSFRDLSLDDRFPILTLEELLAFAAAERTACGQTPAVIIEIKHAAYFESIGLSIERALLPILEKYSLTGKNATARLESFEIGILRRLRRAIDTPIIQLLDACDLHPADALETRYGEMATPRGLSTIASYASAVGACKRLIVPAATEAASPSATNRERLANPTDLIDDAHRAGLAVHAWTFRDEAVFLATDYANHPEREYRQFLSLGLDGFITDFPATAATIRTMDKILPPRYRESSPSQSQSSPGSSAFP